MLHAVEVSLAVFQFLLIGTQEALGIWDEKNEAKGISLVISIASKIIP